MRTPRGQLTQVDEEAARPYRIWHTSEKRDVPYRYYSHCRRCLERALVMCGWEKLGTSLEVYDARVAKHYGTFTRRVDGVKFDRVAQNPKD